MVLGWFLDRYKVREPELQGFGCVSGVVFCRRVRELNNLFIEIYKLILVI